MKPETRQDLKRASAPAPLLGRTCYGVALAGSAIRIVRARRLASGRLRQSVIQPASAAAPNALAWQQWLLDKQQPTNLVAGCVLAQESLALWLQTPLTSLAKAKQVLPALLDVQLPFPLENCYYCCAEWRRTAAGTLRALAIVARRENLKARLMAYAEQGLQPAWLDHEGLALWSQSCHEHPLAADVYRVILCLELDHLALVVGRGDCFQNAHGLLINLTNLIEASPERAGDLAGLIGRIQRIMRAELPESLPVHWMLGGAGAAQATLTTSLHQALAAEWPGPCLVHQEPETLLARALSARALTGAQPRCNLRVAELAHPLLRRRLRQRAWLTAGLFLASGLLLCALNLSERLLLKRRAVGINRSIELLAKELTQSSRIPYGQELREARKAMEQRSEQQQPFLDAFAPAALNSLAELLRAGQASGVAYENLTLQRGGFSLRGACDDWDQCAQLAASLQALGYETQLDRQEALQDAQVRFMIKGERVQL